MRLSLAPEVRQAIDLRSHAELIGALNEPPMLVAKAAHGAWMDLFDRLREVATATQKF